MASGLRPRPYLPAFRVFGCASGATGLHIIFHALPGVLIFGYASMNHPRLFVCRPPDSKIPLAYGQPGESQEITEPDGTARHGKYHA